MKPIALAAGLCLLIAPFFSFSQIPGYQGKRWAFTAGPGLNTFALLVQNQQIEGPAQTFTQASVRASYVTGRHISAGLSLTYVGAQDSVNAYKYAAPGEAFEFLTTSNIPYNIRKNPMRQHFLLLSAEHRFILNGKKGALAPCGLYMEGGAGAWIGWFSGVEASFRPYLMKYQIAPSMKAAIGSQKVYKDRFIIDLGVESTIPLNIFSIKFLNFNDYPEETFSQYNNAIKQTTSLWLMTVICPYVRVGLLR